MPLAGLDMGALPPESVIFVHKASTMEPSDGKSSYLSAAGYVAPPIKGWQSLMSRSAGSPRLVVLDAVDRLSVDAALLVLEKATDATGDALRSVEGEVVGRDAAKSGGNVV